MARVSMTAALRDLWAVFAGTGLVSLGIGGVGAKGTRLRSRRAVDGGDQVCQETLDLAKRAGMRPLPGH